MIIKEATKDEKAELIRKIKNKQMKIQYTSEPELLYLVTYDLHKPDSLFKEGGNFDYNLLNDVIEQSFEKTPCHILRSTWLLPFDGCGEIMHKMWEVLFQEVLSFQKCRRKAYIVAAPLVELEGAFNPAMFKTENSHKDWESLKSSAWMLHDEKYTVKTGLEDMS